MKYVKEKIQSAVTAIQEKPAEEAAQIVTNLFLEVEMEMDFLERRRAEAEDAFTFWLEAISQQRENNEKYIDSDENFITSDE